MGGPEVPWSERWPTTEPGEMKELPGKEVELERNMSQTFTALFVVCVGELWSKAQWLGSTDGRRCTDSLWVYESEAELSELTVYKLKSGQSSTAANDSYSCFKQYQRSHNAKYICSTQPEHTAVIHNMVTFIKSHVNGTLHLQKSMGTVSKCTVPYTALCVKNT